MWKDFQTAFYNLMWPNAVAASKRTGIDPKIIFAQSALESNWGRSAPNNNYFGIKGPGSTQTTKEFINGAWVTIKDAFKGYSSPADSASGYADFILGNKRYTSTRNASGIDAQLKALQASGYATDPTYSSKLKSIINNMPSSVGSFLEGLVASPQSNQLPGLPDLPSIGALGSDISANLGNVFSNIPNPIEAVSSPFAWIKDLFSVNMGVRVVAVIAGLALVIIAIAALTLTSETVQSAAKTALKVA